MLGIKETMNKSIEILEEAISDVGYWRWWAEKLPDVFQVEFGGVQLWNPPTNPDGPPSGIVALRFIKPTVIAFLTENGASDIQDDWPASLHDDSIDSFTVDCDRFTFTSETEISETLQNCSVELKFGTQEDLYSLNSPVKLAFRAENVGLRIEQHRCRHDDKSEGEIGHDAANNRTDGEHIEAVRRSHRKRNKFGHRFEKLIGRRPVDNLRQTCPGEIAHLQSYPEARCILAKGGAY